MNILAQFVHSKISGNLDDFEQSLSNLEKLAWKDLQMSFNASLQEPFEKLKMYTPPAEWPTGILPSIKFHD